MKSKYTTMVLLVVLLFLSLLIGKGIWRTAASNLTISEQELFINHNLTNDEFAVELGRDIHQSKVLAETCLLVIECTPSQHEAAIKLAKANESHLASFRAYQSLKVQVLALYSQIMASADKQARAQLIGKFLALRGPFETAAKAAEYDRALSAKLYDQGNLPRGLEPSFKILR